MTPAARSRAATPMTIRSPFRPTRFDGSAKGPDPAISRPPTTVATFEPLNLVGPGSTMSAPVMKTVSIALLWMRPRLRDILTDALAREPDMHVLEWQPQLDTLTATRADVVVCEAEDPLEATVPMQLLRALPESRVLMVAESGDRAAIYELRPTRALMRKVGMDHLVAAIRFGVGAVSAMPAGEGGPTS